MKQETRYRYEKRIDSMKQEIERLRLYRSVALDIQNVTLDLVQKGGSISLAWILGQFRRVQP